MSKTYVIIGASAAGVAAVMKLRQLDPQSTIICISQEAEKPYNKCFLAEYVIGVKDEPSLAIGARQLFTDPAIVWMLGCRVERISPQEKCIFLHDGQRIAYDALFLGMGSVPRRLSVPGADLMGVFSFHTLADIHALQVYIKRRSARKAVIIGSGLSGLECADALTQQGLAITVLEIKDRILAHVLPEDGSLFIERAMKRHGITLNTHTSTVALLGNAYSEVVGVKTDDNIIPADVVIVAIGMQPQSHLAAVAGITLYNSSIMTDDYLMTGIPHIYAGGDVCVVKHLLTGELVPSCTWPDAMLQGATAAHGMTGIPKAYPGLMPTNSTSFFGLKMMVCGTLNPEILLRNVTAQTYRALDISERQLKGFALLGDIRQAGTLKRLILTQQEFDLYSSE